MTTTKELFSEAISLPVDIKTYLVEELLRSLYPTNTKIVYKKPPF